MHQNTKRLPSATDQGLAVLWLAISGAAGVADHIVEVSKSQPVNSRKIWPWPMAEMSAGLLSSAQVTAIINQASPSDQGYEQNCSLPFFSTALDKARAAPAKFDRAAIAKNFFVRPGGAENTTLAPAMMA